MFPRLTRTIAGVAATTVLVAGCASAVDGTPTVAGAAGATGASGSAGATAFPRTAAAMIPFLQRGITSVSSVHLDMISSAAGAQVTMSGDEKVANGKVQAMSLVESIPQLGRIELRIIGDTIYVKSPLTHSSKPWVKGGASSSDPIVHAVAAGMQSLQSFGMAQGVVAYLRAATQVRFQGTQTYDGTTVGKYAISVDLTKLPASFPLSSQIGSIGVTDLPLTVLVDAAGHTRRTTSHLTVQGQSVNVDVQISRYNQPVTVTAPPASQTTDS